MTGEKDMAEKADKGFPRDLLERDNEARFVYFVRYVAAHRLQQKADKELVRALERFKTTRDARPNEAVGTIILLYGPTGGGKTQLKYTVQRRLLEQARARMKADSGYMPYATLDLKGPDTARFSWLDVYERANLAVDEPLIAHKIDPGATGPGAKVLSRGRGDTGRALRLSLESAVRNRKLDAFFWDEAHHVGKVPKDQFKNQMESLKSLTDTKNTAYILMGTYDLLPFRTLNGQLGRRCVQIHLPRYRLDIPEDVKEFKKALRSFQRHLPLAQEPRLVNNWRHYYDRSAGCVGVLKDWLSRALFEALLDEAQTLTPEVLERTVLPADEMAEIAADIVYGEGKLLESASSGTWDKVADLLERKPRKPTPAEERRCRAPGGRPGKRRKPGERLPARDPGGEAYDDEVDHGDA